MNNMNESKQLKNKINKLDINITYYCANNNYQEIIYKI